MPETNKSETHSLVPRTQRLSDPRVESVDEKRHVAAVVEKLLKPNGDSTGTVDDVLNHAQVKKHGLFGRLSASQQSLVTSVVSVMQDKHAKEAQKNAEALQQVILSEREAVRSLTQSFADTAKNLYSLPLIRTQKSADPLDAEDIPFSGGAGRRGDDPPGPTWVERFFTWGNLLAISAVVLMVLVVKTSVDTANFETQYRLTEEKLAELEERYAQLEQQHQALRHENKQLAEQGATLQARLESSEQQLQERQAEQEKLLARLANKEALISKAESVHINIQSRLNKEISALKQELAAMRGKEVQQDENYRIWKQLAEERKDEIARLQTELLSLASKDKQEEPDSGFFNIF